MVSNSTLVLFYNSFKDPLLQNIVLPNIITLAKEGIYEFHIVSFEQDKYRISESDQNILKEELKVYNIYWYPLTFHTGRFLLAKKAYDFLMAFFNILKIYINIKFTVIFSYANVSASIGILLSKILKTKFLIYTYEPHSDFMVELGIWEKSSYKYKILNALENYAGKNADYILTGTKHMVKRLSNMDIKGQVFRAPTCIDENKMYFSLDGRNRIRSKYNIENRDVLIYLGKFGGLYYNEEVADLCSVLKNKNSNFFFLILTPNDHNEIRGMFNSVGLIDREDFIITETYTEVRDFISASDIGLNAIPPTPSQIFRSPTKVGEYLLCGLPYITCFGISEDDSIGLENKVGVALKNFDKDEIIYNYPLIKSLIDEDKTVLMTRCRNVGLEYRAKSNIDHILKDIYKDIFTEK